MADPLSVAASVVGILAAAAQVTQTLTKIIKNVKDAPEQCRHTCTEVGNIRQILEQLQTFLIGTSKASRSRTSLILVEQVLVTLTSCVTTFSDLDVFVELLDSDIKMGLMDRLRWSMKAKDMSEIITRLQLQKTTITLILGILTCQSVIEAETKVDKLYEMIERTLESNETMAARLRDLEPKPIPRLSDIEREVVGQDLMPGSQGLEPDAVNRTTSGFGFEEILMQSRAYKRSVPANTEAYSISLVSTAGRSGSWTMLSGLSLSEISNIAILALPLYAHDISNNQHYSFDSVIFTSDNNACTSAGQIDLERPNSHTTFPVSLKGAWRNVWKGTRSNRPSDLKSQASDTRGVFGVPLRVSIHYQNVAISLIDQDGREYIYGYVPTIVAKCCVFLKNKGSKVENIIAVNGHPRRVRELEERFNSRKHRYGKGLVWNGYTVHDAAGVLLRYLKGLPEPVVPYDMYDQFVTGLSPSQHDELSRGPISGQDLAILNYQELIQRLPPINRQLLLYLLDVLAFLSMDKADNLMTAQRLAASLHPAIISKFGTISNDDHDAAQRVVSFLIESVGEGYLNVGEKIPVDAAASNVDRLGVVNNEDETGAADDASEMDIAT
ncbi:hypothetical protein E8E14_002222 [Neopestalotiopsis sp. 37M]|nr:hypothetical protein E8E14_002222 [Neopestalotiopsis sp. 37M]